MKKNNKNRIAKVSAFFEDRELTLTPILLSDNFTKIINQQKFVQAHLSIVQAGKAKMIEPYLSRLEDLQTIIKDG